MGKMDKKWVAICSSAIASVYGAGLLSTQLQANAVQTQAAPQAVQTATKAVPHKKVSHSGTSSQKQASAKSGESSATTQTKSQYKDGTYIGEGYNRRGLQKVAVTIKQDKITKVEITDWEMHYSESDIVDLPGEVVKNQSANVQLVSGATYSSEAFSEAVQDALSKAHSAVS